MSFLPALHHLLLEQGWDSPAGLRAGLSKRLNRGLVAVCAFPSVLCVMDPLVMHGDRIPKGVFPVGHTGTLATDLNLISSFARGAPVVEPPLPGLALSMECKEFVQYKQSNLGFPCISWWKRHWRGQVSLHEVYI